LKNYFGPISTDIGVFELLYLKKMVKYTFV